MTPEELERLAREAGLIQPTYQNPNPYAGMSQTPMAERLSRFAALVRAQALDEAQQLVQANALACADGSLLQVYLASNAAAIRALAAPQSPAAAQSTP